MNNKKEQLKKMAAVMSALSIAAVNFSGLNNVPVFAVSSDFTNVDDTSNTEGDNTSQPSEDDKKMPENNDDPNKVPNNNQDSGKTTTTTETAVTTTESSTTTTVTTTTAVTNNEAKMSIRVEGIRPNDKETMDTIIKKIKETDKENLIKEEITYYQNQITIKCDYGNQSQILENMKSFEYVTDTDNEIYHYIAEDETMFKIKVDYYLVNNNSNGLITIDKQDNVEIRNDKTYLKSGTNIDSITFSVNEGYTLTPTSDKNRHKFTSVNGTITIDNEGVKNSKTLYTLSESEYTINLSLTNVKADGNDNYSISVKLNDINDKEVHLEADKDYQGIKIGDSTEVYGTGDYTIKNILQCAGYTVSDDGKIEGITGEQTIEVSVKGIPSTINAKRIIDGVEEEDTVEFKIEDNNILIPLIVNGEYYLSGYSYERATISGNELKDMYDKLKTDEYMKIEYKGEFSNFSVTYEKMDSSSDNINAESIINAVIKHTENSGKRNDSVIAVKSKRALVLIFAESDEESNFNGKQLRAVDCIHSSVNPLNITRGQTSFTNNCDLLKLTTLFDVTYEENGIDIIDVKADNFYDPELYIYVDKTEPKVNNIAVSEEYNNGWSNEKTSAGNGQYDFSFTISDDVNSADIPKEYYDIINENPNLNSIKYINVGGLTFERPDNEKGWSSEKIEPKALEDGADIPYSIVLNPVIENGIFSGTFNATLTLNAENQDYCGKIDISATDNCGNTSGTSSSVDVKIDITAPKAESINVENVINGLNGQKVLPKDTSLTVKAETSDKMSNSDSDASGVSTIKYEYAVSSSLEDYSDNSYTFDENIKDSSDIIKVTVTDKAGNSAEYYYHADETTNNVSSDKNKATTVIIDKTVPNVVGATVSKSDYENNGNRWYKDYQPIAINPSDSNSGIKTISMNINGSDFTIDINDIIKTFIKKDENGNISIDELNETLTNLRIGFEVDSTNNQHFRPYIYSGDNKFLLADDYICSLGGDGKLSVQITLTDYAGNVQSNMYDMKKSTEDTVQNVDVYIDNNAPVTDRIINAADPNNAETKEINFKSFGTFANKQVEIKVQLSDNLKNIEDENSKVASSGFKDNKVYITFAEKEYEGNIDNEGYAHFTIPDKVNVQGNIQIKAEDNVGNILEYDIYNPLVNEYGSDNVIIENKAPTVIHKITGENKYDNGSEVWYSSDVTVEYSVSDKSADESGTDSGLESVEFKRIQDSAEPREINANKNYNDMVMDYRDNLSTKEEVDGEAIFSINAKDNAGNLTEETVTVYKDTTKPEITQFEFYLTDFSESPASQEILKYGIFFDVPTTMVVHAIDQNASSGIKAIYCNLLNPDGSIFAQYDIQNPEIYEDGVYRAEFEIPEGFKGDIQAWAVDNVTNQSDVVSPEGLASENQTRHDSHASISIEMPQTANKDVDGLPLYNSNITASVTIEDDFSGINTIEWLTSDFDGWRTARIDSEGNIYGDYDGWSVDATERNIVLSVSNGITVSRDANDNFIMVRITDNSGNTSESEVRFSIDKQAPNISVSGIQPSTETQYYNSDKKAHIVIAERNFNAPMINGTADSSFTEDPNSIKNTDSFKHIKDISYDKDGTYHLDIEDTDLAGNVAIKYSSGNFVIDKTDPVLEVAFSKQSGEKIDTKKDEYINDIVKASISVEELNFDSSKIKITINDKEYTPSDWKDDNGKHTATIPYEQFKKDGKYTVSISGTDLASNAFKTYSASFIIDTESPEISVSGFDTANKGEVAPVIDISDKNLDEYELKISRNGKICEMSYDKKEDVYRFAVSDREKYITGKWTEETVDGNIKQKFVFDNFPSEECFDGSYSIEVSAVDKSGNSYTDTQKFSVNRFGSVFTVEDIEQINGKYLNKAPNIFITETNVDKHQEGSDIIIILDKGSATEQLDESMYDITGPELLADKSGYEYKYVIKAGNFSQDLDYKISIQTIDEAGNQNVSTGRGAELGFNVDTHEPEFKCDELIERAEFRESEKTFRINANEKLKHVTVTTSLDEVLLDIDADDEKDRNDNSYTFNMPASNSARSVTIELTDLAGNKTVETFENLLITENMFLYLFHKTWVKVTGGIAILGIGTASGFTIAGRKRRRRIR
ncbi:MAG: hypothetical protein NC177_02580 [Ruminococcus flavefaciens]|nr:hypothetical protein [Ruminococcus flavefaciens]